MEASQRQFIKSTRLGSGAHYLKQLKFFGWNICFLAKKCPLEVWGVFFAEASQRQFSKRTKLESGAHYLEQLKIFLRGCLIFSEKMSVVKWGVFFAEASQRQFNKRTEIQARCTLYRAVEKFFLIPPKPKKMSIRKVRGISHVSLSWTFKVPRRAPGSLNLENWMTVRTEINRHDFRKGNERPTMGTTQRRTGLPVRKRDGENGLIKTHKGGSWLEHFWNCKSGCYR